MKTNLFSKHKRLGLVICLLVCLLTFYFLSEGLAWRLLHKGHMAQSTFSSVYAPIIFLCNHSDHFDYTWSKYEHIWYDEAAVFTFTDEELKKYGIQKVK